MFVLVDFLRRNLAAENAAEKAVAAGVSHCLVTRLVQRLVTTHSTMAETITLEPEIVSGAEPLNSSPVLSERPRLPAFFVSAASCWSRSRSSSRTRPRTHQSPTGTVEAYHLGPAVAAGEELFFRHFGKLNEEEKFHFDQLRAMTEGPLHQGNQKMLNTIESNPGGLKQSRHWPSASGVLAE
jgi:hypothetical protein